MEKYACSISDTFSEYELNTKINLIDLVARDKNLKNLLSVIKDFNINMDLEQLIKSQITIRMSYSDSKIRIPLINSKYYDSQDNLVSKIKIGKQTDLFYSFEGEIYENLDFNKTSLVDFIKTNNYEYANENTTAFIHFKAEEWNNKKLKEYFNIEKATINNGINDRIIEILNYQKNKCRESRELYIVKNKRYFMLYYNAPYIFDSVTKNTSFTSYEIDKVIATLKELLELEKHSDEKDNFMTYMINFLKRYESNVDNRGYKPNDVMIDEETLAIIEKCVLENRGSEENINFKLKVISENPILLFDEEEQVNNKLLVLKSSL